MFTGIIVGMGRVVNRFEQDGGVRLEIEPPKGFPSVGDGASIAVNGCCLTALPVKEAAGPGASNREHFYFDAVGATLEKTRLGHLNPGDRVNLEFGMKVGDPLDGHLVTGHVDGLGTVVSKTHEDGADMVTIEAPPELQRHLAARGSVAMDGVSLTLAGVEGNRFTVSLIPYTLEITTLGELEPGKQVHLETDVLAKYVVAALDTPQPKGAPQTRAGVTNHG